MAELKAIRNHIIFQMEDNMVKHMGALQFEEKTDWNFTIVRSDDSTSLPRWGIVIKVGNEVPEDIQPGMRILIEPLKWTNYFEFEGEKFWRTDSDAVMGIDEDHINILL